MATDSALDEEEFQGAEPFPSGKELTAARLQRESAKVQRKTNGRKLRKLVEKQHDIWAIRRGEIVSRCEEDYPKYKGSVAVLYDTKREYRCRCSFCRVLLNIRKDSELKASKRYITTLSKRCSSHRAFDMWLTTFTV
jgi:hypothetical protein